MVPFEESLREQRCIYHNIKVSLFKLILTFILQAQRKAYHYQVYEFQNSFHKLILNFPL